MGSFGEVSLKLVSRLERIVHTIRNHDTILSLNGFVRNGFGEINGEQHRVHLPPNRVERSL